MSVVEAAYDPVADDDAWGAQVLDSVHPLFRRTVGVGITVFEHDPECASGRMVVSRGTGPLDALAKAFTAERVISLGPDSVRALFCRPAMVTTHLEIEPTMAPEAREIIVAQRKMWGVDDVLGVVVHPEPGVALIVSSGLERATSPTRHERHLLSQLGLHLSAAVRLRRRPESVHAILSVDGKNVDHAGPREPRMEGHVHRVELSRARGGADRSLDLWPALVAGRYSLVPRSEHGRRSYLVLENSLQSQEMRALTRRELDVLSMAARGMSAKLVAYGLGLSPSAVSSTLGRAASKLGLSSRLELLRLAALITGDPRAGALPATVTAAESAILALLREGLSNREIARLRSRSVRTIANQVASLLRKTDCPSRRALVADPRIALL